LKILYLTPNFEGFYAPFFSQMMKGLAKHADVKFYGSNYPPFYELGGSRDILKIISHLYGGDEPNVVLQWDFEGTGSVGPMENMDRLHCLRVLWSCDIHKDAGSITCLDYIRKSGIGLILMSYDVERKTSSAGIFKGLNVPIEYYPFAVDPEIYRPMGLPKKWDVSLLGHMSSSYYPYRNLYDQVLRDKGFSYHSPNTEMFWGQDFIRHINESRIGVTCTSSYKYPLPKILEVMSCQSLLMCDRPMDADYLHYVSGENYVEVGPENILEKVGYYLLHPDEAARISENGRKTVLQYHTDTIRGMELVQTLSKYAR